MSIDKQLHALIAERPRTKDELLAAIVGAPNFILMRIGYLVSKGRAKWQGDQLVPHDGPVKKQKPRKVKEATPPPEPQPFEVAVFMDGTVELINAQITDNGSVCLPPEDARRMAEHILALLPRERVTVTE